jgi:hypothetical protein
MRRILLLLLSFPALACSAASNPEGRWEGPIQIPGRELQLVVDLARDSAGAWIGSIIVPGLGVKGAPLSNVVVADTGLSFDAGDSLLSTTYGPAGFKASLIAADGMAGEMRQGGNVAKFSLRRVAPAQVEPYPRSTSVRHDLEGQWGGDFELGGYPRHVTITFENHANAAATAKFVVVGKQTTNLPVDLVIDEDNFLRIESQANRVAFEGRFVKASGEISGIVELGSLELPLVLRRASGSAS